LQHRVTAGDPRSPRRCNGPRAIIAAVTETVAAHRILFHLGLPTDLPELASARAPPQLDIADRYDDWAT
jgi:hypothetical protein